MRTDTARGEEGRRLMPIRNRTRQLAIESAARPKEAWPMQRVLAGKNWGCAIHLRPVLFLPEIESRPRIQDLGFSIWASAKHFFSFRSHRPLKAHKLRLPSQQVIWKNPIFRDR